MKILGRALAAPHIDRRQDATVHRHQMRREDHDHFPSRGLGEFLIEFGHVAVMSDAISVEAFGHFREQHRLFRRPPCPGHAGLGIDHDLVGSIAFAFNSGMSGSCAQVV